MTPVTCERLLQVLVDNHMLTSEEVMQLQDELQLKTEDEWLRLLYRWEAAAGCELGMWPHRPSYVLIGALSMTVCYLARSAGVKQRAESFIAGELNTCGGQHSKQVPCLLQCKVQQA